MSNKRYFWLKLQSNFFDRDDVKLVEGMDNGKDYIIFYMKLILRSINSGGELRFKDTIPYNEKMLARLTDTNIDIVKSALNVFIELGMMERWDDGTLFMNETANMIGSETSSASRVRRHREKQKQIDSDDEGQKALPCNTDETKSNTEIEKELDLDLDLENKNNMCDKPTPDRFEEFWTTYPKERRINKKKCLATWVKQGLDNKADLIIERLKNQVAKQYQHTEARYIPHALTYLNGERWEDEVTEIKPPKPKLRDLSNMNYEPNKPEDYQF